MENANLSTSFKHHFWNIDKESWCVVFFSNNETIEGINSQTF